MLCRLLHLSFCHFSFDHCVICPPIYGFWLPLWYLRFTDSDYPFGILDLQILITPLVSFDHCAICPSPIYEFWLPLWYLRFTDSDYPFWYPLTIVYSVLLRFTDYDYLPLVSSNFSSARKSTIILQYTWMFISIKSIPHITIMILKIDLHDITDIALKVALNTIILTNDDSCHIHLHLHLICFC